jgi:hypothetical protein
MSDYNTMMMRGLQSDDDLGESREYAIEARAAELLAPGEDCDPMDGFNVIEAMEYATNTDKKLLGDWLATGDYSTCGLWMSTISKAYWAKRADEQAEEELT